MVRAVPRPPRRGQPERRGPGGRRVQCAQQQPGVPRVQLLTLCHHHHNHRHRQLTTDVAHPAKYESKVKLDS